MFRPKAFELRNFYSKFIKHSEICPRVIFGCELLLGFPFLFCSFQKNSQTSKATRGLLLVEDCSTRFLLKFNKIRFYQYKIVEKHLKTIWHGFGNDKRLACSSNESEAVKSVFESLLFPFTIPDLHPKFFA